jgi:acyl-CoA synthetase (NDP forming)
MKETFSGMMPYFGSAKNPIDLTGEATSALYNNAFRASLESQDIHALISMYCETAVFDIENLSPIIEENYRKFKGARKPTVFCLVGGQKTEDCVESLRKRDVPVFTDPYEAVSCMGALYHYTRCLKEPPDRIEPVSLGNDQIEEVVRKVKQDRRHFLLADEGRAVMEAADIPVPVSFIAHHLEEAVTLAEKVGYPVVMKIVSKDILHKSDVGGIALDLLNRKEVIEAYEAIMHNCRNANPNARLEGVEITEMVRPGVELIVGARVDPSFGPIVMCGLGGIYVEVMKDVSFRGLPLDRREVITMIKEIKSYPILLGVRGEKKKDIDSLVNTILKVGAILQQCPGISDIEINPLVVHERDVKAVDVRILLSKN